MTVLSITFGKEDVTLPTPAPYSYNNFIVPPATTTTLNDNTNTPTAYTITNTGAAWPTNSRGGPPTVDNDFPLEIFYTHSRGANGSPHTIVIGGLDAGQGYNLKIAGWNTNARDTDFTVNGSLQTYTTTGDVNAPEAPLLFTGVADGSGNITILCELATQFYAYINGIELEVLAPSDTVTPDADTFYGDTLNYTTTLTGVTGATLTDSSGNTLSLTSVTDTSASIPALVAGLDGILIENDVVLEVTDGSLTASAAVNFVPPTGFTLTTLASVLPFSVESDWTYGFDTPAAIGDQSLENAAFATHNDDGTATFTDSGTYTYYVIDSTDGVVSEIVKTVAEDGVSVGEYVKPIVTSIESTIVSTIDNLLTTHKV
jgi:hypothetical protein